MIIIAVMESAKEGTLFRGEKQSMSTISLHDLLRLRTRTQTQAGVRSLEQKGSRGSVQVSTEYGWSCVS